MLRSSNGGQKGGGGDREVSCRGQVTVGVTFFPQQEHCRNGSRQFFFSRGGGA